MHSSFAFYTLAIVLTVQSLHSLAADQVAPIAAPSPSTPSKPTVGSIANFYPFSSMISAAGRQAAETGTASIGSLVAALLGLAATGRVAPVLVPVLVKFLVLPFMSIIRSIAKGLTFVGVTAFLLSSMVPALLTYMGLVAGTGFMGRAQQTGTWLLNPVNDFIQNRASGLIDGSLDYLDMNSGNCKAMLTCRVGKFMVDEYPSFTNFLKQYGIYSMVEASGGMYTKALLKAMSGDSCDLGENTCPSFKSMESYLYSVDGMSSLEATTTTTRPTTVESPTSTTTTTTTTTTPSPSINEVQDGAINVMQLLKELKNYYDMGQWRNLTSFLY